MCKGLECPDTDTIVQPLDQVSHQNNEVPTSPGAPLI